nr:RNA-directed DNA polymerase, eukaryota, reverse transcriptase zinc-binding domain protein [Tanacetum cinerariifolium]
MWPNEWQDRFSMITSLITPCLEADTRDQLVWIDKNENNVEFSARTANSDLNLQSPIVKCHEIMVLVNKGKQGLLVLCPRYVRKAKDMAGIKGNNFELRSIIEDLINAGNGNSLGSVIRRLVLATSVYTIWQERNGRIFKDIQRNYDKVLKSIVDRFSMITSLITPCIEADTRDQLVWIDKNESNVEFSARTANSDLNLQSPIVKWWD